MVVVTAFVRPSGLTALLVIGNVHSVFIEHSGLKAGIRAHIDTDLFPHKACIAPSSKAIKQNPENFPWSRMKRQNAVPEFSYRSEIADKRKTDPQAEQNLGQMLKTFGTQLVSIPWHLVEFHLSGVVTLNFTLQPHKGFSPYSLRTGIATPESPGDCREEK